ncbi:MAG: hypothetical protein QOG01_202 [Pseudonocardiales bacterium]|jgi:hypothetical protein|nr:hypothetical protein [Pseudonocardiales bacterium]
MGGKSLWRVSAPVLTLDLGRGIVPARGDDGGRMAELLMLEFDGLDETDYAKVNAQLGLDPKTGAGDWPAGLISHLAGVEEGGSAYVIEVWESQEAQAAFMQSRLGAALAAGGVSATPKVTWARLVGHQNPGL